MINFMLSQSPEVDMKSGGMLFNPLPIIADIDTVLHSLTKFFLDTFRKNIEVRYNMDKFSMIYHNTIQIISISCSKASYIEYNIPFSFKLADCSVLILMTQNYYPFVQTAKVRTLSFVKMMACEL